MARKSGLNPQLLHQMLLTGEVGATDTDYALDAVVPCAGAVLKQMTVVTKTAGATTGTFTLVLQAGDVTVSQTATVDADGAAGVVHASVGGIQGIKIAEGAVLELATVKTGTVSTGAILWISLLWEV